MPFLYQIVKADYLQRTRSYYFLITLAVTVFMAYAFIPAQNASYTTLSASGYKGAYNSAWVGYVSGIMTTVLLSYLGFVLVNSSIKKDIETEVGLIIATTPISNFKYLLSKHLSNYLVLLTIVAITLVVSIGVFFYRGTGYPFVLSNFLLPYLFFAVPALFVVAALAVAGEVFLGKRNILQFVAFFSLCGICMTMINKSDAQSEGIFDPFGLSLMSKSVTHYINTHFDENIKSVSFGFIFNGQKSYKLFEWQGLNWSTLFIISRLVWIGAGLLLIYISSLFFHRFDFKQSARVKTNNELPLNKIQPVSYNMGLHKATLPLLTFNYGIYAFVKMELLLLIRQGSKWLWLLNAGLWIAMCFTPFSIAHAYLLPILLFLQVGRWSELATKEKTNRVHYFAYASYKPLQRLLTAQILSGVILAIGLSFPIIVRCLLSGNGYVVINIINGAMFVVLLAVALGIISGGKKMFEIFFFLMTYAAVNRLSVTDYLGSLPHPDMGFFMLIVLSLNVILLVISLIMRSYQARHL